MKTDAIARKLRKLSPKAKAIHLAFTLLKMQRFQTISYVRLGRVIGVEDIRTEREILVSANDYIRRRYGLVFAALSERGVTFGLPGFPDCFADQVDIQSEPVIKRIRKAARKAEPIASGRQGAGRRPVGWRAAERRERARQIAAYIASHPLGETE